MATESASVLHASRSTVGYNRSDPIGYKLSVSAVGTDTLGDGWARESSRKSCRQEMHVNGP